MTNKLKKYYIIYTYLQYEDKVLEEINKQAEFKKLDHLIETIIVPKKIVKKISDGKLKNKEVKLLDGYVIIKAQLTTELYMLIKSVKGVMSILSDKKGDVVIPSSVSEEEVNKILGLSINSGFGNSVGEIYNIGDEVMVISGALENSKGEVVSVDGHRICVNINIFGSLVESDMDIGCIKKVI